MLVEIIGDQLYYQTLDEKGATVDSGSIRRRESDPPNAPKK